MMKKRILSILAVVMIGGLILISLKSLRSKDYESDAYRWHAQLTSQEKDLLIRGAKLDRIKDDLDQLIYAVNGSDQDPETFRTPAGSEPLGLPKLKLIEITDQQVVVEVINALYLTQRMGSTGASVFLAEATFTLTEYKNIHYVHFQFEEGDHATPGIYTRADFLTQWQPLEQE
jgi:hypothetical protein